MLTAMGSGHSEERLISSRAGLNVAVGSTQSTNFASSSSIILSASNGRDAIWSGACAGSGNKPKICKVTITGNTLVT
ncbi:hypothetical protein [Polaromonas sp. CG9_12]|nr:hypothetical protein [Polaromonas sp. CG9_12]